LFLAQRVFLEGGVPYQAFDALPLAAQPYAAMLDVVLTAARTGASRDSAVELLRSGLLEPGGGEPASRRDVSALEEILTARRGLGEADTFGALLDAEAAAGGRPPRGGGNARRAARVAVAIRDELMPFRTARTAAAQVRAILDFIRRHERLPESSDPWLDRHLRARAGVQSVLVDLAQAFEAHDNGHRPHEEIAAAIRFAIESRTFIPEARRGGVSIVDAVAARFGTFDHAHVVGLVETDWPERPRRSIFYTSGLLRSLGWPQEPDQVRLQQAMFVDLLALPASTVSLHAFRFEGDALLALSPLVELARDRRAVDDAAASRRLVFDDEVLTAPGLGTARSTRETGRSAGVEGAPDRETRADWLDLRIDRPPLTEAAYGGFVGAQTPRRYRVSRVDHYVACPFKYFAENVLDLPEEREEMAGQTPLERGNLLHQLFERFYRDWDRDSRGAITPANLPEAVARFGELVDAALARLPEADRALERTRLLGSLVAQGLAERVFELEADRAESVSRRLLECDLKGPFVFPLLGGLKTRTVEISGKADRIDVMANGSIRVIDYKLSRLPDLRSSVQIAVYAYAAKQLLEASDGQPHPIAGAAYLAFGDEDKLEGALGSREEPVPIAVEARAAEFAGVIERIESGQFPPQPRQPGDCAWCRYAGVCRKEYREAGDETAESL
jgi:RecB family exonuclease